MTGNTDLSENADLGENTDMVLVGEIGAAQGLKGEVRLRSYTQDPADVAAYGPLQDEAGAKTIEIERVRVTPKALIARIKGISTREGAQALTGTKLYVARVAMPAANEGEWYVADLIGLEAVDREGAQLGTVVGVHNYGASDIIEIASIDGTASLLVAFTETTVPEVDVDRKRLVLIPPEDLPEDLDEESGEDLQDDLDDQDSSDD